MIILKFSYKYAILLFITKKFLWTNGVEITKKHLLAWEKVCLPRTAGDCALCDRACETTDHLFFFCEFAKYICSKILNNPSMAPEGMNHHCSQRKGHWKSDI